MPDFALEKTARGIVAGVDESGRGPLAGPVVAAAVVLDRRRAPRKLLAGIDDCKALRPDLREEIVTALAPCARIAVGAASAREVDALNVLRASLLAMRRAVVALGLVPDLALVDGQHAPDLPCPARAVVGGDGLSLSVAAASVVAKVTRDRLMGRLAPRYPGFGWEHNAGYGTPEHLAALARLGPTAHHRRTFAPVLKILSRDAYAPLNP